MNTYEIEVDYVEAGGTGALHATPRLQEVHLAKSRGKDERARVTWTFHHLPAGLTPVITFGSPEVIASGPATTLGDPLKITCEIRFPPSARKDLLTYSVEYGISTSGGSAKKLKGYKVVTAAPPPPEEEPNLVVIRSPDPPPPPPSGRPTLQAASRAKA
jgi:hypothetical protein